MQAINFAVACRENREARLEDMSKWHIQHTLTEKGARVQGLMLLLICIYDLHIAIPNEEDILVAYALLIDTISSAQVHGKHPSCCQHEETWEALERSHLWEWLVAVHSFLV